MESLFGLSKADQGPNFYEILGCDQNSNVIGLNQFFKI